MSFDVGDWRFGQVLPERLEELWPVLEPWLQRACDAGTTDITPAFIKASALANKRMVWVIAALADPDEVVGVASTFILNTARGQVVQIESLGGKNVTDWLPTVLPAFEKLAREKGMTMVSIEGRRGWERMLPSYRPRRVVLEKVL